MTAEKKTDILLELARWQMARAPGFRAFQVKARGHHELHAKLIETRSGNSVAKRIIFEELSAKPLTPERIRALIDDPLAEDA